MFECAMHMLALTGQIWKDACDWARWAEFYGKSNPALWPIKSRSLTNDLNWADSNSVLAMPWPELGVFDPGASFCCFPANVAVREVDKQTGAWCFCETLVFVCPLSRQGCHQSYFQLNTLSHYNIELHQIEQEIWTWNYWILQAEKIHLSDTVCKQLQYIPGDSKKECGLGFF